MDDHVFFTVFSYFDKCRPEIADDFIYTVAVAVDLVGMDVRVKFVDSALDKGLIIKLVTGWSRFTHLHAVLNCSLQPTGSSWPRHIRHVYVTDCLR